ncbi:multiple antibiotic resistance (MarC)-related protein [alpha proteobacterium BAL199]|jgi:multiple antibiotic resistance protein|nr:multiple antibiotic resistance (MarC)-related protein [alpha proteobacterium BAL199]
MLRSEVDDATATATYGDAQAIKVGVVPLGIPLMAGPGSFTAVILESQHSHSGGSLSVSLTIIGVAAVMWVLYLLAVPIARILGPIGLNIITRLFGLVVTAIGVEIIVRGIQTHVASFMSVS